MFPSALFLLCCHHEQQSGINPWQIALPIITAIISAGIAYFIASFNNKKNQQKSLDDQLDNILKIAVQYPYLEMENFTHAWTNDKILVNRPEDKEEAEKYQRYDIYSTLVFNYMQRYCEFHEYQPNNLEKVDIKSWIKIHKEIWNNPVGTSENIDGYPEKFRNHIKNYLNS